MKIIKPQSFSRLNLLGFWLFAIFLPAIFLRGIIKNHLHNDSRSRINSLKTRLLEEMRGFSKDLDFESWLTRKFKRVIRKLGLRIKAEIPWISSKQADHFFQAIKKEFKIEPWFFVATEKGSTGILSKVAPILENRICAEFFQPRPIMRYLFSLTENEGNASPRRKDSAGPDHLPGREFIQRVKNYLIINLGLQREEELPRFAPGKTDFIFTNKFSGKVACLFFDFFPEIGKKNLSEPPNGFFCALPRWKIDRRDTIKWALRAGSDNSLHRRIFLKPRRKTPSFFRFRRKGDVLFLESIAPPDVLHLFDRISSKLAPVMVVSVSIGGLIRDERLKKALMDGILLLFWGGTFFGLLRLGVDELVLPFSLRGKLLLSMVLAGAIPIIGCFTFSQYFIKYHLRLEAHRARERLSQTLEEFEINANSFESWNQFRLFQFRRKLEKVISSRSNELLKALSQLKKMRIYKAAYIFRGDGLHHLISFEPKGRERNQDFLKKVNRFLTSCSIRHFLSLNWATQKQAENLFRKYPEDPEAKLYLGNRPANFSNDFFGQENRMWRAFLPGLGQLIFQTFFIFPEGAKDPSDKAILVLSQKPEAIQQLYFKNISKEMNSFREVDGEYETRTAIFELSDVKETVPGKENCWPPSAMNDENLLRLAGVAISRGKTGQFKLFEKNRPVFCAVRFFKGTPFMAVGRVSRRSNRLEQWYSAFPTLFALYSFLILYLSQSFLSRVFTLPLESITKGIQRIANGEVGLGIRIISGDEFETLAIETTRMSRSLLERERLRRFLSGRVLETVKEETFPKEKRAEVTVLFADIRDFTELSEKHPPEAVVDLLNAYFSEMEEAVLENGGEIDKFIGDAVMAVFRRESLGEDHPFFACLAGQSIKRRLDRFNLRRSGMGLFTIRNGVGIATGIAIEGHIGSAFGRIDHTFIGDTVNVAARLEGLSKKGTHSGIILSQETAFRVKDRLPLIKMGEFPVKGKAESLEIYELIRNAQ